MSDNLRNVANHPFDVPLWSARLAPAGRLMVRTRGTLERQLIVHALRDPAFRHEFMADAKPFVEAELGYLLPDSLQIEVLEESGAARYLVIPHCSNATQAAEWILDGSPMSLLNPTQASDLLANAWADEAFRARLLADPVALLDERFGVRVEPDATLYVRFETTEKLFIVIPDLFGYNELDESDYEDFVSFVNEPLVVGSPSLCTVKTTESPYGCGPH